MSDILSVNTTSRYGTHFLRGVELIIRGREEFKVPSENWPYPTEYFFGMPTDYYYAEVWVDGMDWQPTYWLIESENLKNPKVHPLIIFESNEEREKFNDYDFRQLILAVLWHRRDSLWVKHDTEGVYNDTIWPYLSRVIPIDSVDPTPNMDKYCFSHGSQKPVNLYMNNTLLPERALLINDPI